MNTKSFQRRSYSCLIAAVMSLKKYNLLLYIRTEPIIKMNFTFTAHYANVKRHYHSKGVNKSYGIKNRSPLCL